MVRPRPVASESAARLVGRVAEIAELSAMLRDACEGRGAVALVEGDAGIGKTRLAEEAAVQANRQHMVLAWGHSWEHGGAPPFWPWTQALRSLSQAGAPEPGVALARLLPELAGGELAAGLAGLDERFALFDEVLRYLSNASAERATLIVLEDLHAADVASLELLAFVARHARDSRLAIVATLRPVDAERSPVAAEIIDRARRNARRIELRPLGRDEVAELARDGSGGTLSDDTVRQVLAVAEGYPLYVTELVRILASRRDATTDSLPVPTSARAILRARLEGVAGTTRELLDAASVIGREAPLPLLAAVCGRTVESCAGELEIAAKLGVIMLSSGGRARFSHALFADTLRKELSSAKRAELHLTIATALEQIDPAGSPATVAEIAHHLLAAGPRAAARAIEHARLAAGSAIRTLALEEAIELLLRARDACDAVYPPDHATRAEVLVGLARAYALAGDIAAARTASFEVAELARHWRSPDLLARAGLALGAALTVGTTDRQLVELLRRALRELPRDHSTLRAQVLARLASALQPSRTPEEPVSMAREAIAMTAELDDDRVRLEVLHLASAGLAKFAPPDERLAVDVEAARLAEELQEPSLALRARMRLVIDRLETGDLPRARDDASHYAALAARARPEHAWPVPMLRAMFALYEGRLVEHDLCVAEAKGLVEASDDRLGSMSLEMHEIGYLRTIGDDGALRGRCSTLWQGPDGPYELYDRVLRAMIFTRTGREAEIHPLLARHDPSDLVSQQDLTLALWAGEAAARVRDPRWAEVLLRWLRPQAERVIVQGLHGMFVEGPVARVLVLLADVLDEGGEARSWLDLALERLRADGAAPLEARLLYEWGAIRAARGDATEAERALGAAHEIAVALGLPLAGAIARARAPVEKPRSPNPSGGEVVVLVRDGDGWALSGLGATVRMRSSRGLEMLSRLLEARGREVHCLDLTGVAPVGAGGDAGEAIDRAARDAYRARLLDLDAELSEAEAWNDLARADELRGEAEALRAEVARGVGLGGRPRRSGAAAERARINAQRRIADAIRRIHSHHAKLGEHLARSVRTGTFCSYDPDRPQRR